MKRIKNILFSTRTMTVLFLVFAISLAFATFIESKYGTDSARKLVYNARWFEGVMLLLVINFAGNIFRYKLYTKSKLNSLVFHLSFLVIFIGAFLTRYVSFEGMMSIKEGEVSNTILSNTLFLNYTVDDNKEQQRNKKKLFMSPILTGNSFEINDNFKGKNYSIVYKDFIPNAVESLVEEKNGEEFLELIESSYGNRHTHFVKSGDLNNIHGFSYSFNNNEKSDVKIFSKEGKLKFQTIKNGSYMNMQNQNFFEIKKDSVYDLKLKTLYSIQGNSFVIAKHLKKAVVKYTKGNKDNNPRDLLVVDLNYKNKTKTLNLLGKSTIKSQDNIVNIDDLNFRINYGSTVYTLPFSVKLKDFQLEKYPGSDMAASYASEIHVNDGQNGFDYRIFMNNVLDYRGYRFFQSSYKITPEGEFTFLSVNHDFWGTTITYIGYVILFLSLIFMFFSKNSRFSHLKKQLKGLQSKKNLLIILILTSFISNAQNIKFPSKEHADKFGRIIVQDFKGRMKTMDTYSSEILRKLTKKDVYNGYNSNQFFLSLITNPEPWGDEKIIYIDRKNRDKLCEVIGIPKDTKYAKITDFFEHGKYKIQDKINKISQKKVKNAIDKDLVKIAERVNVLSYNYGGYNTRIFPIKNDKNNTWISIQGDLKSFEKEDSIFVKNIIPLYSQSIATAIKTGDYKESDKFLEGIINFQKKFGSSVMPSQRQINLEIAYNKYDIFKKLFSYYMYVGLLMILLVIIQIFKNSNILNKITKVLYWIVIMLFISHTLGLASRWYISGHAPWSNGYESVIYVAWATMLFGIYFSKKSILTMAATTFLTSIILMIAHWNWADPDIGNLVPVLNSYWLMIHVSIIVASYGPFALSMILGLLSMIMFIFTNEKNREKLDLATKELTIINEMSMTIGLVLLVIGNFLGGMWANESWGRYWGWDSKETWALVSIMVYALILHLRFVPGLRGKFTINFISTIAFSSILMTYFGVNFYLTGMHSYGKSETVITPNYIYYIAIGILALSLISFIQYKKYRK